MTRLSRQKLNETHASGIWATDSTSKSVKRSTEGNSEQIPDNSQSKETVLQGVLDRQKFPRWTKSWVLWTLLLALIPGTIGFMATAMLLKLPSAPNCPSIFWPLASASVRMHCAQLAASKQTVKDLLSAIALVQQLPKSHPLRGEIERLQEECSRDILQLAGQSFQAGNLDEAIETARKIPEDVSAYKLVDEQISKWQSMWSKAEGIYQQAETQMREQHWHQAFMLAARLLRQDNKYWATTKYDELNRLITTTREDGDTLAKAKSLGKSGVFDNLLKAIKLAGSIEQESYIYPKAQKAIPEFGRKMLELAQTQLDKRDADKAIDLAQRIPPSVGIQMEIEDFITLAEAQKSAWVGSISGLETAVSQAQQIDATRPVYEKSQKLIAVWQLEIEDISRLEKARYVASGGTISDLTAAIAEAQLIPRSNPRGLEARQEIGRWVTEVQTIEDQPYLDRAEQIALLEDVNSLQAAIAETSQIRRGRALYREAQRKIAVWTQKIQRIEDQPYLEQARELAQSGNLPAAVNVARQITPGRVLSGEAQTAIDEWQGQIRSRQNWQNARDVALTGTPSALAQAIRLANRIPDGSSLRNDVNTAIDQWSQQLLDIARSQGESDITRGIETAKLVPRGTAAYSAAQEQIRAWQEFLRPEPEQTEQFEPLTTEEEQ